MRAPEDPRISALQDGEYVKDSRSLLWPKKRVQRQG